MRPRVLIMAIAQSMPRVSVYETRGLEFVG